MKRAYSRAFTPKTERRVQFMVDRIPPSLMRRVRAKAKREGVSLRALILGWLDQWATAPAVPSSAPPELSRAEWRLDATGALDDVVVENVKMFRMERMAPDHIWGALYYPNGTRTDFNIFMHDGQLALTFEHQFKETR